MTRKKKRKPIVKAPYKQKMGMLFKKWRLSTDLSPEALAEKLGVSKCYVYNVENGTFSVSVDMLLRAFWASTAEKEIEIIGTDIDACSKRRCLAEKMACVNDEFVNVVYEWLKHDYDEKKRKAEEERIDAENIILEK